MLVSDLTMAPYPQLQLQRKIKLRQAQWVNRKAIEKHLIRQVSF